MSFFYCKNIVIFKNILEDLIEIFMKEFQKNNISGVCVLGNYLFNQYVPESKIIKNFSIRNNKYYCLHVWIENGNEIYENGTIPTKSPEHVIEEPIHLPNIDNNYEEFYLSLTNSAPLSYYKNAPRHIIKCIKSINRKVMKNGIVKPIVI